MTSETLAVQTLQAREGTSNFCTETPVAAILRELQEFLSLQPVNHIDQATISDIASN